MKNNFRTLKRSAIAIVGTLLLAASLLAVRQVWARTQIENEWQAGVASRLDLQITSRLEILPLFEAVSSQSELDSGHGVSYLVRTDATTVLLDLGFNSDESATPAVVRNMLALGVEAGEIDAVIISHPHPDHVGGQGAWQSKSLYAGSMFTTVPGLQVYTPVALQIPEGEAVFEPEPFLLTPDVGTTGVVAYPEIFPLSLFEPRGSEQALVVRVADQGLVLITGCGHPTLEKLVARAEAVYGFPVVGVVGGLHYGGATPEELQAPIRFMLARQPGLVSLSPHDSLGPALEAFQAAFPEAYQRIEVGRLIQFP